MVEKPLLGNSENPNFGPCAGNDSELYDFFFHLITIQNGIRHPGMRCNGAPADKNGKILKEKKRNKIGRENEVYLIYPKSWLAEHSRWSQTAQPQGLQLTCFFLLGTVRQEPELQQPESSACCSPPQEASEG